MSGGSYNYLCFHTDNLTDHLGDLEEMSKRLDGLPWASEVAADTRRVAALLEQAYQQAQGLSQVWRAVEWWDSGDSGEEQAREEAERYRTSCSVSAGGTVPNNLETT